MTTPRAGIPLVLAVQGFLTGIAVGTFIATAWNSGDEARGLVRAASRTLHRPPRDVRARMAVMMPPTVVRDERPTAA